jgi:hypothetical protein
MEKEVLITLDPGELIAVETPYVWLLDKVSLIGSITFLQLTFAL